MEKHDTLLEKFLETQRTFGTLRHRHAPGGQGNPAQGRGRILALLKLRDGIATRDIAQILGIRVSSLNEVLAKMEKDGLIERTPSPSDGRVMLVSLTEAGRDAAPEAGNFAELVFAGFADSELDALDGFLDRIAANLDAQMDDEARAFMERAREAHRAFREHPERFVPGDPSPHGHHGHGTPHGHSGPFHKADGRMGHSRHGGFRHGGSGYEPGPDCRAHHDTTPAGADDADSLGCIRDCRSCTLPACVCTSE